MIVNVEGARLFFDVAGPGLHAAAGRMEARPTLIVLHGGPGFDHSPMRPYFDRYADTHQVVYLDHRGNGRSSGAPDSWTLRQWGRDVKSFCEALGIEKPVIFGVSFGGMVAMSYAIQFPDHPAKLILSSTAAKLDLRATYAIMEERGGAHAREVAERVFATADDAAMEEYRSVCIPLYNTTADPDAAAARDRAIIRHEVARHFFLGEMRTMDQLPALARIACPTLILAGRHDPITPVPCSEDMAAAIPAGLAQLLVFDNAGHGVHRDDPDGADKAMRAFLAA
ncbi:hypothetical protein ATM17_24245 [Sphingopyxis macrogoltabida]|uniref:AB hydrolase-1 domain-containing protein n=2 Tax=Sphingopyxis macrogoltabida TaxID=33050 RepID=A0AAC9FH41_SPHMC|nr:hypothetical protein LH19_23685 [Sphingopyxis macrogoltabida]AMU92130.1 hypothetical protein ATM17_24245 [Sphingopyxis macrogoltabida]